jgi:hypothetical protein
MSGYLLDTVILSVTLLTLEKAGKALGQTGGLIEFAGRSDE